MARKLWSRVSLLVAAALPFLISTVEKLHLSRLPQADHGPQLQRREEDLAIQLPDEGEHPRLPMVEPPPPPIGGPTTLGGVGMAAVGSFPVGGSADTRHDPLVE